MQVSALQQTKLGLCFKTIQHRNLFPAVAFIQGANRAFAPPPKAWFSPSPKNMRANWAKILYYGYHNTTNAVIQKCYDGFQKSSVQQKQSGPYLAEYSAVNPFTQTHRLHIRSLVLKSALATMTYSRRQLLTFSSLYVCSAVWFYNAILLHKL